MWGHRAAIGKQGSGWWTQILIVGHSWFNAFLENEGEAFNETISSTNIYNLHKFKRVNVSIEKKCIRYLSLSSPNRWFFRKCYDHWPLELHGDGSVVENNKFLYEEFPNKKAMKNGIKKIRKLEKLSFFLRTTKFFLVHSEQKGL